MGKKIDVVTLHNTNPGHSKEYCLWIEEVSPGQYKLFSHYGRIGATPQYTIKTPDPVSLSKCQTLWNQIYNEKSNKGYVKVASSNVAFDAPFSDPVDNFMYNQGKAKAEDKGPALMHLVSADEEDMSNCMTDPSFGAQEKKNGRRLILETGKGTVRGWSKLGKPAAIPANFKIQLKHVDNYLIDGEIVGEKFFAFDMLRFQGADITAKPFSERYSKLKFTLLKDDDATRYHNITVVPLVYSKKEKAALFKELKQGNREGIVFKDLGAKYTLGKGHQVAYKYKFYAEGSFHVVKWNQKNSVEIVAYDGSHQISVGNVTVPEKYKKQIAKDDIIRVRYLYATSGNQLYQPNLDPDDDGYVTVGDMEPMDCLLSQLKYEGQGGEPPPTIQRNLII